MEKSSGLKDGELVQDPTHGIEYAAGIRVPRQRDQVPIRANLSRHKLSAWLVRSRVQDVFCTNRFPKPFEIEQCLCTSLWAVNAAAMTKLLLLVSHPA
jgi:hypothetical protein